MNSVAAMVGQGFHFVDDHFGHLPRHVLSKPLLGFTYHKSLHGMGQLTADGHVRPQHARRRSRFPAAAVRVFCGNPDRADVTPEMIDVPDVGQAVVFPFPEMSRIGVVKIQEIAESAMKAFPSRRGRGKKSILAGQVEAALAGPAGVDARR